MDRSPSADLSSISFCSWTLWFKTLMSSKLESPSNRTGLQSCTCSQAPMLHCRNWKWLSACGCSRLAPASWHLAWSHFCRICRLLCELPWLPLRALQVVTTLRQLQRQRLRLRITGQEKHRCSYILTKDQDIVQQELCSGAVPVSL